MGAAYPGGGKEIAVHLAGNAALAGDAGGLAHDEGSGIAFSAIGRVDNRDDLGRALGLSPAERAALPDASLLWRAYRRWGDAAPARVLGDWAYAAWHPREQRLVAARDQLGAGTLYHAVTDRGVAWATSPRALLALPWVDARPDESRLAAMLLFRRAPDEATFFRGIRRLPAARVLDATPGRVATRRYWRAEDAPPVRLRSDADYAEALRDALDEAVRARLHGERRAGVLLSSGLDSGAITALAGRALHAAGRELAAYTWVPAFAPHASTAERLTDEGPLALATARFVGNVRARTVDAADVDVVAAMTRMVAVHAAPVAPPANAPWVCASLALARDDGVGVLLDGVGGNATISWAGAGPLRWRDEAAARGWLRATAVNVLRPLLPSGAWAAWRRRRARAERSHALSRGPSPIADAFARRVERDGWVDAMDAPASPDPRLAFLHEAHAAAGPGLAALSRAYGLSLCMPAFDVRVVELCLGIPGAVYTGRGRLRRWPIREAMRGLLPEAVRLQSRRGEQGADLVARLRASVSPIDAALDAAERSALAREYVDVARMRAAWRVVLHGDAAAARAAATTVLLRGLHAAIFLRSEVDASARGAPPPDPSPWPS